MNTVNALNFINHYRPHKHYLSLSNHGKAVLWMLAHCLALTGIMVVVRTLGHSLTSQMIMSAQNFFGLIIMTSFCLAKGNLPKTKKIHLHALRSVSGTTSGLILFYALTKIDLNTATSISFCAPLFTTIMAIIFLREKAYSYRMIGLAIGFTGVMIVLRPGTEAFNPDALFMVLVTLLWGVTDIFIKLMSRSEQVRGMLFYKTLIMTIFTIPLATYFWQTPTQTQIFLLVILAALDITNIATISVAYKYSEIGVLMPFDFSRLVFSSIAAFLIFNETLDVWVFVGSAVIVYGTLFVVYKEKKRSKIMSNEVI